jgi:hypothetical protein
MSGLSERSIGIDSPESVAKHHCYDIFAMEPNDRADRRLIIGPT